MDLKNDAYSTGMSDTPTQLREFFFQVKLFINIKEILSFLFHSVFVLIFMLFFPSLQLVVNFVKSVVYIQHY